MWLKKISKYIYIELVEWDINLFLINSPVQLLTNNDFHVPVLACYQPIMCGN